MPNEDRIDRVYANLLTNHDGWALWRKCSAEELKPGAFGYFDADGVWKPIVNLMDDDELRGKDWNRLERSVESKRDDGWISWGPKVSTEVEEYGGGGTVGGPIPHVPGAELSATFKLKQNSEKGAILVTEPPIVNKWVADDGPLLQWIQRNRGPIVQRQGKPLKEHGLWVITKTWETRRSAMAVLRSEASEGKIGLNLDFTGVATLAPEGNWSSSTGDVASVLHEHDDCGLVVMMCGILVTKLLGTRVKTEERRENQKMLRGGTDAARADNIFTFTAEDEDGSEIELSVERYPLPK